MFEIPGYPVRSLIKCPVHVSNTGNTSELFFVLHCNIYLSISSVCAPEPADLFGIHVACPSSYPKSFFLSSEI